MNLYFISGLGADERVFTKLVLPPVFIVHHIKWPKHDQDDTIESYARRIASLIDTAQPYSIVGLSFGGMIAVELSKFMQPAHILVVSTITSYKQLPPVLRFCGRLGLVSLVPSASMNKVYPFTHWFTGLTNKDEQLLVRDVIHDTDPGFLKWAIKKILTWENTVRPEPIFHLHGSKAFISGKMG